MAKSKLKYTGFDSNFPNLKNGDYYTYDDVTSLTLMTNNQVRKRLANKKQFSALDLKHSVSKYPKPINKIVNTMFIDDEDGSSASKKFSQKWLSTKTLVIRAT